MSKDFYNNDYTKEVMDEEKEKEELEDIGEGSIISLYSISIKRTLEVVLSYIITLLGGAPFYGLISVFMRMEELLSSFFLGGMKVGINRTFPRLDNEEQNSVITFILCIIVMVWTLISLLIYLNIDLIIDNTLIKPKHRSSILLFSLSLLFFFTLPIISTIFRSYRQIRLSHIVWTISRPMIILVGASFSLLFISETLIDTWSIITLTAFIVLVLSIYLFFRYTDNSLSNPLDKWESVKDFFYYTLVSTAAFASGAIQHRGVFVLMAIYLSPTNAGLFSLSFIIAEIVRWPLSSINVIFPPVLTEAYDNNQMELLESLYERTSLVISLFAVPLFSIVFVFHNEILTFFSPQYSNSTYILIILGLSQLIASSAGSIGLLLHMIDRQKELMWLEGFITVVFFPIVILITIEYGLIGLAVGGASILVINNILEILLLKYTEDLYPFTMRHLYLYITGLFYVLIVYLLSKYLSIFMLIVFLLIFLVCYFYISYNYILEENDRALIYNFYKTVVRQE